MSRKKRALPSPDRPGTAARTGPTALAAATPCYVRLLLARWLWLVPPLLIVVAGIAAYANSFAGCFLFDDEHAIVNSLAVRQVWPFPGAPLPGPRSLVTWTLALSYALGGLNTWGYHAFNLAVHLLAGLTLYGLVLGTLSLPAFLVRYGSQARWLALAVALIWVVHPLQTESVTYIVQRAEAMTGLFYLLVLFCVLHAAQSGRLRWWWYAGCLACCGLGMLCKEVMCTAPVVAVIYDRVFLAPCWGQLIRRRGLLYLGLAATLIILVPSLIPSFTLPADSQAAATPHASVPADIRSVQVQTPPHGSGITAGFNIPGMSWQQYARTQPQVILHYLRLAIWPDSLCLDYRWPVADSSAAIVASMLVGMLVLLTLLTLFRWPALGFVAAAFFVILAPTSTIMPIADLAVEHRMYLPLATVVLFGVLGAHILLQAMDRRLGAGARLAAGLRCTLTLTLVLVLGVLTYARNCDYESDLRMWADVANKRPANPRAHNNLGKAYADRAQLDAAARRYRLAVRLSPDYVMAHYNLGTIFMQQGAVEQAIAELRTAVALDPTLAKAHNNLGSLLGGRGDVAQAVLHLREAIRLDPDDPLTQQNLGLALLLQGNWQGAADAYRHAVILHPSHAENYRGLAFALRRLGQTAEARQEYEESLRLNPRWPAATLRDAWDLATSPYPGRRHGMLALQLALQTAEATGEGDPHTLDVLAAAYAEAQRFPDAVATAHKALQLAKAGNRTDLAAIGQRLHAYKNKQPFRAGSAPMEAP
jgi:Flp pilus assembly protein TadD